jgi:MoaA/NifB/PqqE/SkfB family radical SAM enzyme
MLVRITNSCRMGCSHCMIDATSEGQHMSIEMFGRVLEFIKKNNFMAVMISGGEPLDHPDFFTIANMAKESGLVSLILSNGMFLEDAELRDKVLSLGMSIQVTNDERFYPKRISIFEHSLIAYEDHIRMVSPIGRAKTNKIKADRGSPLCFNLRSLTRNFKVFNKAVLYLRTAGKMCTPSINVDGSISAGESSLCHHVGTIDSSEQELVDNISNMRCNKCGLEDNLEPAYKKAIGI